MDRHGRRWILVGVVALLVVTAGCSSVPSGQQGGTDASPVPTGSDTPTATPTPSPGAAESSFVEPPFDQAGVQETHAAYLEEQGSFTVRRNTTVNAPDFNLTQEQIVRFDLERGTALATREPLRGGDSETYLAPNGSAYEQRQVGETVEYNGPGIVKAPNATSAMQFGVGIPLDELTLEYEGHTTDGVEGHVYTASDAAEFAAVTDGYNESEIAAVELAVVLAEAGYVKRTAVDMTVEVGEARQVYHITRRYVGVGSTTVTEPDWLDEAIEATNTPDPTERVTRQYDLSNDDGTVNQSVTAARADLEWASDVGPERTGSYEFSYPLMDEAHVGPVVRLRWPEGATRVEATYHYDVADLPRGNESALTVTVYDRDEQRLFPARDVDGVSATVDPDANTVTVAVAGETALERYRGNAFIAMDFEYFVENLPTD